MPALYERARPRHFSEYHGQPHAVGVLQKIFGGSGSADWKAVLISGSSGMGKTTLARILAVAVNCKPFGKYDPADFEQLRRDIDFTDVNAADYNGIEAMRSFVRLADLMPMSRKKVILMDEAHELTRAAQNCLLKPLEDGPDTTLWILCTTDPSKIIATVKQRCLPVVLRAPDADAIKNIIAGAKKHLGKEAPDSTKKLRAFLERGTYSGRQIVTALERYATKGKLDASDPTEEVPSIEVCRALLNGDWLTIQKAIHKASADGLRQLRMAVLGYLRAVAGNPRTDAKMMDTLFRVVNIMTILPPYEDPAYSAWFTVALWESARLIRKCRQ